MSILVADTSGLVSLGVVADVPEDPFSICLSRYEVIVPDAVIEELRELAAYDDVHGRAAHAILERSDRFATRSVALDTAFPLDDGENAVVTLANELDAAIILCDEFNHLGIIHASLSDTRLVTTPTLLSVLVRTDRISATEARSFLEDISDARSWDANSYVQRAQSLLRDAG